MGKEHPIPIKGTADLIRELADEVERRSYVQKGDGAVAFPGCAGCGLAPGKGHLVGCQIGQLLRQARERQQDFERVELLIGI